MEVICEFELAMTVYDHITYCNYQCNKLIIHSIIVTFYCDIICKNQIVIVQ